MRRDRPIFVVKAHPEGRKGRVVDITERVMSFMYLDRSTKADRLEIKVNNSDLRYFDDPVFRKGVILEVSWGYPGVMSDASWVVITGVKGGVELTIEGLSQGILMHQVKKCRVWKGMTLEEMADKVQSEYQDLMFCTAILRNDETSYSVATHTKIIHATQAAMTDAAFLTRLAKKFGLIFSVDGQGRTQFHSVDTLLKNPPMRTITWRGGAGDWESFHLQNDITSLFGAVTSKAIDTKTGEPVASRADNKATKRAGLMQDVEVVDGKTGDTHHEQRAASESVESTTAAESGKEHVEAKAAGKYKASQRGTIKLNCTLIGDPRLAAKQNIEVLGLGKRLSGKYHLIQVRHEVAHGAYRTYLVMRGDGHGGYSGGDGNTPSDADLNKKKSQDDPSAVSVERHEVVDERTGETHQEFHLPGK